MIMQEMLFEVAVVNSSLLVSKDINQDDFAVNRRQATDGSTEETKQSLKDTIKDAIHSLGTTMLPTELMTADPKVRYYLLYCTISIISHLNQLLFIRDNMQWLELTLDDLTACGHKLAATAPAQFSFLSDSAIDLFAKATWEAAILCHSNRRWGNDAN